MRSPSLPLLMCALAGCRHFSPMPPEVTESAFGIPLNGGRVQAVSVHPGDRTRIIVANQFGGLWRTVDGGGRWTHLDGLMSVFAVDVQYGAGGRTVVATIARDNRMPSGGGIWVSRDGGDGWVRPATGVVPASPRIPQRTGAYGIAIDPDDPRRWYVGTDVGVAISDDAAATWRHVTVDGTLGLAPDSSQDAVRSILALPGGRVLAMLPSGVYRSDDRGTTWRRVRAGGFGFYDWAGTSKMERNPGRAEACILQDYETLFAYDLVTDRWRTITLPAGGGSRGPFVRASRTETPGQFRLWVGQGVRAIYTDVPTADTLRAIATTAWTIVGRGEGIHDDTGDLGVDAERRTVIMGTDGGVFRPVRGDDRRWEGAAPAGSRLNSYQITDIAGTDVPEGSTWRTSVYYGTQDNALWASPDGGQTWPRADCAEGFHTEVRPLAEVGEKVTVGYGRVGCGTPSRISDADFVNQRDIPDTDVSGATQAGFAQAFFLYRNPTIGTEYWYRLRTPMGARQEVWVSSGIDGGNWRRRFELEMAVAGPPQRSGWSVPFRTVNAVIPVTTGATNPDGSARLGLVWLTRMQVTTARVVTMSEIVRLPANGSLGVRATEFDWQAVFGVDPRDNRYVIAPDIVGNVVRVTRDRGTTWQVDTALTAIVTQGGALRLWDASAYRMQVTHIGFDPHRAGRILVGTRDAGIACSRDGGSTWRRVPDTEKVTYITGFQFRANGATLVSSYGQGLWFLAATDRACSAPAVRPRDAHSMRAARSDTAGVAAIGDTLEDANERPRPVAQGDTVPRLVISTTLPTTGVPVIGADGAVAVRGEGYRALAGRTLTLRLDGRPVGATATVGADGGFRVTLRLSDTLAMGGHRLTLHDPQGQVVGVADVVRAHRDEHLGRPMQQERTPPASGEPQRPPSTTGPPAGGPSDTR